MDDELSRNVQKLIDVAMAEDLPPPAIADGSWEIVVSRLTIEAAKSAAPARNAVGPSTVQRRNWVGVAVLALALVAAGGLLWLVAQPRPVVVPETAPPPAKAPAKASKAAPADVAAPVVPTAVDPARLLDEAADAEPARALELLAEHAQLAPLGAGAQRRMALRISALCALGRTDDARAEARAFLGQPRDPEWAAHVRSSCAGK